jgi:hypothetical protein
MGLVVEGGVLNQMKTRLTQPQVDLASIFQGHEFVTAEKLIKLLHRFGLGWMFNKNHVSTQQYESKEGKHFSQD